MQSPSALPTPSIGYGHDDANKRRLFLICLLAITTTSMSFVLRSSIAQDIQTRLFDPDRSAALGDDRRLRPRSGLPQFRNDRGGRQPADRRGRHAHGPAAVRPDVRDGHRADHPRRPDLVRRRRLQHRLAGHAVVGHGVGLLRGGHQSADDDALPRGQDAQAQRAARVVAGRASSSAASLVWPLAPSISTGASSSRSCSCRPRRCIVLLLTSGTLPEDRARRRRRSRERDVQGVPQAGVLRCGSWPCS